jgi:electron transport complex protein RnfE
MSKNNKRPQGGVKSQSADTKAIEKSDIGSLPKTETVINSAADVADARDNKGKTAKPAKKNKPVSENVPENSPLKKTSELAAVFKASLKINRRKVTTEKAGADVETPIEKPVEPDRENGGEDGGVEFWGYAKEHVLSENPVFVKAIAIIPILGAATSLKNGILLSFAMILTVVLLNIVMYPFNRRLQRGYRAAVTFVMAGIIITPVCMLTNYIAPSVTALCGIYLPLLAICAIPMIEKKHYGVRYGIVKTVLDAALDGFGFAFAAILFSVVREIFGNGTLYDRPLPGVSQMKFSFSLLPAGAFLLLGLLAALFRKIYGVCEDNEGDES